MPKARVLLLLLLGACVPDVDSDESTVSEPRVIAIQAEPAEAAPNDLVKYRALLVDAQGEETKGDLQWFYCSAPKPLAELGPINRTCLYGKSLERIGKGVSSKGTLPKEACALFGPNPPPPVEDEPPGRPVDPDLTGGYKQPVMLGVNSGSGQDVLLYEQRIACGLASVAPKTAIEFTQRYHANENPAPGAVSIKHENGSQESVAEADVLEVKAGERVTLTLHWPECPQKDACGDGICGPDEANNVCNKDCQPAVGCKGQERYVWFDAEHQRLTVRRESMRVAWYATAGSYEDERTGVDEDAASSASENHWTAPSKAGSYALWTVLRDARGGVGFRRIDVKVH